MKTVLNVKVDKQTKVKVQRLAKELGLSVSAVINVYLKDFVRTKSLSVSAEPGYRMTPKLERELAEVEEDIKHNRNFDGPFSTDEELDQYFSALFRKGGARPRATNPRQKNMVLKRVTK